jgi:hypothetical protein
MEGREGEKRVWGFLSFKTFSNLNSFETLKTTTLLQNFQIILKTFKTSHIQSHAFKI